MLARRLVVCLDVAGGKVVKGVQFESLEEKGDPADLALKYDAEGADEIVFLNIASAAEDRAVLIETVRRAADKVFIPMTVGGGVSSVADAANLLRAGADKVSINSASVFRPALITETADVFGAQCVVASIDARRENESWRVYVRGGREATNRDAIEWAKECADRGAGEILLTSIDRDGTRDGFDVELTRAIADEVSVPVVASGGGGNADDVVEVIDRGGADAALMAGALHDGSCRIIDIKRTMRRAGLKVRATA